MIARAAVAASFFALLAAACGGGAGESPPQTPKQETVIGPAPGGGGEKAKTLVELRRDFMSGCTTKVPNAPDYCECGWEQMTKTFTEAEMNSTGEDKAKLAQLKDRIEGTCKSKLPEDTIKASFVQGCTGEQPKRAGYCDCTWGEFRKKLSAAEMSDDAIIKTERFTLAKRSAAKACSAKMPEDIAREGFALGCVKDEALRPFCTCAWKTLRAEGSAAEIEGGLVDVEATRPKIEKSCGKLRPAK